MKQDERPLLGIDIGGTKIAVCVGLPDGRLLDRRRFPAEPERGPEDAVRRTADAARESLAAAGLTAGELHPRVGVSAAGPLSSRRGIFLDPPNMPGWHGFPITEKLGAALGLPVELMNDANAAAWAEWRFGAGRGSETMVFVTMSTGMGAGLVIGGRLHEGRDDFAGEVGHARLSPDGPVGFGRRGSLEGYCSGPGIEQLAALELVRARHDGRDSSLLALPSAPHPTMPEIGAAAHAGDPVALAVLAEVGERFGTWAADIVDLLNPERIVLGTIGRLHFDLIAPAARAAIDREAHPTPAARVELLPAALGETTGELAALAAVLARRRDLD
ncbi:MAG: ROK family protein [Planctomycetota bacterium]